MKKIEVEIECSGQIRSYQVRMGIGFQGLSAKHGGPIEYDCRKADCGICVIRLLSDETSLSPKTSAEEDFLNAMKADSDERLACQCRILDSVKVQVEI